MPKQKPHTSKKSPPRRNPRVFLPWTDTIRVTHCGRYCGDQMCCWGPAGTRVPKDCRAAWDDD
jgi:hypothetical protein